LAWGWWRWRTALCWRHWWISRDRRRWATCSLFGGWGRTQWGCRVIC
jgi:hypothetical protein